MITSTELHRKLRRDLGDKLYSMVEEEFYNEIIEEESLRLFSEYYPLFIDIKITADCRIPMVEASGKKFEYSQYKIPPFPVNTGTELKNIIWIDIADYYITGNDLSNVYTGGNLLLNSLYVTARSAMPHTRSFYNLTFKEPDVIVISPQMIAHRDFQVKMKAERTLMDVPRSLMTKFTRLVVCDVKIAIYNRFKYSSGTQTYGGVEIDTKIDDLRDAENERRELIEGFEKDWILNPEQFDIANLFMTK